MAKSSKSKKGRAAVKRALSGIKAPIPGSSNRLLQRTINPLKKVLKGMKKGKRKGY